MKRTAALFLVLAMILPIFAAPPTADPDTGATAASAPMGADLAPEAAYVYSGSGEVDPGTGHLLLVNHSHHVSADYIPEDLVTFSGRRVLKPAMDLRPVTKAAYEKMSAAMDAAGLTLYICSAFRTYEYQTGLFNKRMQARIKSGMSYAQAFADANLYTAYPGTSEHETGLAIDLAKDVYATLNDAFADTPVGIWLAEHCADYGFILRYRKDKQEITGYAYEPWHFRYVGLPHSRIMTDRGWALEEYLEHLQAGNQILLPAGDGTVWLVRYTRDYAEIAAMEQVESYSYDNCGGWVVTCRAENPGYYAENHWSEQYFKALLGDKPYGGFWDMVPDHTIPASGFLYLYSLLGDLPVPQLPAEEPMTRGQAALALDGLMGQPDGEVHPFVDDCRIDPRYKPSVYKLAAAGVLQGTTDGRFSPDTPLTWGEAATLLARLKVYLGK